METMHAADPASLLPGTQIGVWRVVSRRGCGSYGVVYRVERVGNAEAGPFALKLALHPLDPRFEREAKLLSRIDHPRQSPPPGTPQVWSPESLRFQWEWRHHPTAHYEASPADDVYALGVTAYRLVTGAYPPPVVEFEETEEGPRLVHPVLVPPETRVTLAPELAALIRQMLSEEPSARGRAGDVAEALERAAESASPKADQPIRPLSAQVSARHKARSGPLRQALGWLSLIASAVVVSLAVRAWWNEHRPLVESPSAMGQGVKDGGEGDAGTVGLGDDALPMAASVALPEPTRSGIGLDMPKKPFPGQRRPPCERPEIEINGGCWLILGNATPPCGARYYAWRSGCYVPVFDPPRSTTSGQP
jgi:hypothetical protein